MNDCLIEVQNLGVEFNGRTVLKDISFTVPRNKITIILGGSGCGKTTVLKHLIGLYPVQKGSISLMGKEMAGIDDEEFNKLALQMGVLFQNGALLNSLTIAENVAIPLQQHTNLPDSIVEDLVRVKLNLVELSHAHHLVPSQLSGGMRKRAALARAIALDPPLLFCDEPSAGLDPLTLKALDELILKLKSQLGMTIVLITHEVSSIFRLADKIVFLDGGKVAYEGDLQQALEQRHPVVHHFFSSARGRDGQ
jgi:phospholipid/cholesterol/gamma-HCH transport system ATP-binding protein